MRVAAVLLALSASAAAAPGPGPSLAIGFRGDGSGRYPEAEPPLHWDRAKNVVWATALSSWGNATPLVVGDCVLVTIEPTSLACLAPKDGRVRWQREITYLDTVPPAERGKALAEKARAEAVAAELKTTRSELDALRRETRKKSATVELRARVEALGKRVVELKGTHDSLARYRPPEPLEMIGSASSTPVSDGRTVYALFGNQVVAAVSLDGKLRWARYLPSPEQPMHGFGQGQSASLLLSGTLLFVPFGRLQALDAATGATRWTAEPYGDYGSPALARVGGEDVVLTPGGQAVRARDGHSLAEHLDFLFYVGPTVHEGVAYYAGTVDSNPPDPSRATAWRLPPSTNEPWKPEQLWRQELPRRRHYATPLWHDGHLFVVAEDGALTILDAGTGRPVEHRELHLGHAFPSPALAGTHLYIAGEEGVTVVLEASAPWREVARNPLEPMRASPVFAGRRLYLRTLEKVYCIEEHR